MSYSIATIVGDVTASFGNLYLVDASNNSIIITLPIATGNGGGYLQFKRVDWVSANSVTIITNTGDSSKIDATMTSLDLYPGDWLLLFVDSTNSWLRTIVDASRSTMFGDGSDGVVSITTNTTLVRDMYYSQLDVGGGAIVITNGFRIFVLDRLTLTGAGTTIHNNGSTAINNIGGVGGAGNLPGSTNFTVGGGYSGVNGVSGLSLAGNNGLPLVASSNSIGGIGGSGGSISSFSGGIAGLITPPVTSSGGTGCIKQTQNAMLARDNSSIMLVGGSSGGSGSSNSLLASSGGSGGGGGIVVIVARSIMCDSKETCTISSAGGGGGNSSGAGSASGGGGGGGGTVILITRVNNALSNLPGLTVSVAGGAGGMGQNGGPSGSAGAAGIIQVIDHL